MRLTFLGTGTSTGVPMVGCTCAVCRSPNPRNKRFRSSVLVEADDKVVLVDAGPDFRSQALRAGVSRVDDVVLTHAHADHILGLDDLRPVSWEHGIDVWGDDTTLAHVGRMFPYFFSSENGKSSRPRLSRKAVIAGRAQDLGGLTVLPLAIQHGDDTILGYRFGKMAYLTDCNGIPAASLELLKGLEVLVLGVLRYKEHATHFNVAQGIAAAKLVGARQTWLTHLSHDLDHDVFATELPPGIAPAFDGLVLELE